MVTGRAGGPLHRWYHRELGRRADRWAVCRVGRAFGACSGWDQSSLRAGLPRVLARRRDHGGSIRRRTSDGHGYAGAGAGQCGAVVRWRRTTQRFTVRHRRLRSRCLRIRPAYARHRRPRRSGDATRCPAATVCDAAPVARWPESARDHRAGDVRSLGVRDRAGHPDPAHLRLRREISRLESGRATSGIQLEQDGRAQPFCD